VAGTAENRGETTAARTPRRRPVDAAGNIFTAEANLRGVTKYVKE